MSDLLQKERTSQAVQTYSSSESNLIRTTDKQKERKEITKEGMEEESETQDKITTTDKQQAKRKSKTPLLPAPTSQGNTSHSLPLSSLLRFTIHHLQLLDDRTEQGRQKSLIP